MEEEEEVAERTATFYLHHHPCYFLEEALRALFRCLGFENGSSNRNSGRQEHRSSVVEKAPSDHSEVDPITPEEITENNNQESSQEAPTTELEEAPNPPSTTTVDQEYSSTTQGSELNASIIMVRRVSRRSELSQGSSPQTN